MSLHESQNILKKQEVRPQNLTSVQCGWSELAIHGLGYFDILFSHSSFYDIKKDFVS